MDYTLWPDLNTPLLPLVDDMTWRSGLSGIGHYLQCTLANEPNVFDPSVGENCYPALEDGHFYDLIGLPQTYEFGIFKPQSLNPDGTLNEQCVDDIVLAVERIIDAGGEVPTIAMDEPFTALKRMHDDGQHLEITYDQVFDYVIHICHRIVAEAGITSIELTEAMAAIPLARWFTAHEILAWTDKLRQAGMPITALRLDISHEQPIVTQHDRLEFRSVRNQCLAWDLPLAVIATPANNRPPGAAGFCETAYQFAMKIPEYFEGPVDRVDVACWEGVGFPTLPAEGPNTLVSLYRQIAGRI